VQSAGLTEALDAQAVASRELKGALGTCATPPCHQATGEANYNAAWNKNVRSQLFRARAAAPTRARVRRRASFPASAQFDRSAVQRSGAGTAGCAVRAGERAARF